MATNCSRLWSPEGKAMAFTQFDSRPKPTTFQQPVTPDPIHLQSKPPNEKKKFQQKSHFSMKRTIERSVKF